MTTPRKLDVLPSGRWISAASLLAQGCTQTEIKQINPPDFIAARVTGDGKSTIALYDADRVQTILGREIRA